MPQNSVQNFPSMRVDKWLWCARFFKTRSGAAEALRKGKVKVNDTRAKPSRAIRPGDNLTIRKGVYTYTVRIVRLAALRQSISQAGLLYKENEDSVNRRQQLSMQLATNAISHPRTEGRPSKRERRKLLQFTRRAG